MIMYYYFLSFLVVKVNSKVPQPVVWYNNTLKQMKAQLSSFFLNELFSVTSNCKVKATANSLGKSYKAGRNCS